MRRSITSIIALALMLWAFPSSGQYMPGLNMPLPLASAPSVVAVPIGTPVSLGTGCNNSGSTSFTFNTTSAIPAGSLSAISFASSFTGSAGVISAVSDGTNTYTVAERQTNGGTSVTAEIWYKANASAVGSGATVTISFGGTSNGLCAGGATITGITATPLDKIAVGPGTNTTSPTVSTGALSQANEIVLCLMTGTSGASGITPDATFSTINNVNSANNNVTNYFASKKVASTGSVTCAPTQASANSEALVAATLKGN